MDDALLAHRDAFGIDLHAIGLADRAFKRVDALEYIRIAEEREQCVLGGDVLVCGSSPDDYRHTHDNWACERRDGELFSSYVRRFARIAREYVSKIANDDAVYIIVVWPG